MSEKIIAWIFLWLFASFVVIPFILACIGPNSMMGYRKLWVVSHVFAFYVAVFILLMFAVYWAFVTVMGL
jgi:hypothetical protein